MPEHSVEVDANAWLVPGGEAVILQPWERSALRAQSVTVERVLKRDVVLSSGERFNKDRLTQQIGGTWGTTLYLVPPSDPRVAETRAAIKVANLRSRASAAYEDWRRGEASAADVAEAFAALVEVDQ